MSNEQIESVEMDGNVQRKSIGKENVCGGGTGACNSDGLRVHALSPSQKKRRKRKEKKKERERRRET